MSRWIDADEMLEYLDLMYEHQDDKDEPYNIGILGAINYIKHKAPSIEIIRCRECKYGEYREEFDDYECHASGCGLVHDADFYCADGERGSEKPTGSERSK